jgi:hypothetical protein
MGWLAAYAGLRGVTCFLYPGVLFFDSGSSHMGAIGGLLKTFVFNIIFYTLVIYLGFGLISCLRHSPNRKHESDTFH